MRGSRLLDRVLDRGQHAVGEGDIVGVVLLRIGAGDFPVVLVHQLVERDLAARDRGLEFGRDLLGGLDHDTDQRRIRGLHAAVGDQRDQAFGDVEQLGDALVGVLEIGRGEVDALGELAEFVDHAVAMAEIGGRRAGDAVDLGPPR